MLLSMINFNHSNLFRIELIFRCLKISLSDDWALISLSIDFASRAYVLHNEEADFCKLLQLFKIVKIDLFSTTAQGRSALISRSIVWSPESDHPFRKIHFCKKNCLPYLQNSDLILISLYLINEYRHSIKTWQLSADDLYIQNCISYINHVTSF